MAAPASNARQIIDIRFDDLVADPIATVRRIYAQFGYRDSVVFEGKMARYLENERAATRTRHVYTLEQFSLSRDEVIDRSAEYLTWVQARYGELVDAGRTT